MHQAIFSGVILSKLNREELYELPPTYNYPIHLHDKTPPQFRPKNIDDLVTIRYEDKGSFDNFPFPASLKKWLSVGN